MSIEVMAKVYNLAVDQDTRDILMALADHADPQGCGVRPSIARLAWKVGDGKRNERGDYKNSRTIQRRIKELLKLKALVLVRKAGYHRANEYRLDLSVFPPKEAFVAAGDDYHEPALRGDNLSPDNLSGDKPALKGDTPLSPESSFESFNNNNNNAPVVDNKFSETQTRWHKELEQLTGGYMGGAQEFMDLTKAWQDFPDERRHIEAKRQTSLARSRTAKVYLKAYLTFNPDWKPPPKQDTTARTSNRPAPYMSPPPQTAPPKPKQTLAEQLEAYYKLRPDKRPQP